MCFWLYIYLMTVVNLHYITNLFKKNSELYLCGHPNAELHSPTTHSNNGGLLQ